MAQENQRNAFERYADDIVIHCSSKEEAERLQLQLTARLEGIHLLYTRKRQKLYIVRIMSVKASTNIKVLLF